ncbi:helix-turn-helix domain-containing protein [Halobacillus sp. Marseille-Q1614]|uniref:helix-turn-helix domain-containing protein n=1 Tax=Halobacillus sp. Marseille-Q1614 TaxID=2709134 RepID=UPI00156FFF8C|nr:helix-turn-helix domain-containing protein [Halobacillus sp. Marseille-Q1614]
MFTYILLDCIESINKERTVSGIYHLIQGKRSAQSLQDAKVYRLERYFGIYPDLKRATFQKVMEDMEQQRWIALSDYAELLPEGERVLKMSASGQNQYFSGLSHHRHIITFEQRIRLLIQTLSQSKLNDFSFIPIIEDVSVQQWVKNIYQLKNSGRMLDQLFKELSDLLSKTESLEAELFTGRLSGGRRIGKTRAQLADQYHIREQDVDIYIKHVFFYLFHLSKQEMETYPVLHLCRKGLEDSRLITQSAQVTYQWLEKGYSLEEVARLRRLKESTIQDHLVEAALTIEDFSIDSFVKPSAQEEILSVMVKLGSNKLKQLFEELEGSYTYFQLRLVVAKSQHKKERNESHV